MIGVKIVTCPGCDMEIRMQSQEDCDQTLTCAKCEQELCLECFDNRLCYDGKAHRLI